MRFDILTLFPEFFSSILENSITGNAVKKGLLEFNYINIRDFADDKHNRVDDYPYGGGPGMLIKPQPVFNAYNSVLQSSKKRPVTVYMSPRGIKFNQDIACKLAKEDQLVIICGHYEGVDQRIIDEICDYELSIGDFVLTGGEIAALTVCDAVSRLVPGVLSTDESFENESHYNGLLEHSQYTRPPVFNGKKVPDVLLSGNLAEVNKWKYENSVEITKINRPDMYEKSFGSFICPSKNNIIINLLIVCDDNDKTEFIKSELLMHLNKINTKAKFVKREEILCCDNLITVVCGKNNFDFSVLSKIQKSQIVILRENYLPAVNLEKTDLFNVSLFEKRINFLTVSELSELIYNYECSLNIYEKLNNNLTPAYIFDSCVKVEMLKPLPYDAYENNLSKFNGYNICDLYLIDVEKLYNADKYTLIIQKQSYEADVFSVKIKGQGRKYCLAVKDLETIYSLDPEADFYLAAGDITKQFDILKTF